MSKKLFSEYEEKLLLKLIMNHQKVICCKETDSKSNYEKSTTWTKITEEFNSDGGACKVSSIFQQKIN